MNYEMTFSQTCITKEIIIVIIIVITVITIECYLISDVKRIKMICCFY